LDFSFGIETL